MTRNRSCCIALFLLLFVALGYSIEPINRVLTQEKLDRFLDDLETIMRNQEISNAWNESYEQASFDELMDPDSSLLVDDALAAVMTIMIKASQKAKLDVAATNVLKKHGWTPEFWDIYVAVMIGVHYKTVIDGNGEIDRQNGSANTGSGVVGLPEIERFISKNDYDLVVQNYSRIQERIDDEIARNNGFDNQ